jgi:transcriptional regulator with XRE-family HTH domain
VSNTIQSRMRPRVSSDVKVPRLREHRLDRAFSQEELARMAGLSRESIIKLEGGRDAWPQTVRKLAKALRVKPKDLY